MANPYEKYATPAQQSDNPYVKYKAPEKGLFSDMMDSPVGQLAYGALEAVPSLPGLPVELAAWAKGIPVDQSNLKDWGSQGWINAAERATGLKLQGPAPTDEPGRFFRKAGNFLGGGAFGGPAGMVPSLTGFAGSEVGRLTDQSGLTGGYGELAGGILGGAAPGIVSGSLTSGIPRAPTLDALENAKNAAYKASEDAGAIFTPAAMERLQREATAAAAEHGYHPANEPGIGAALQAISDAQGQNVTLKGLDKIRKVAGNAGGDFTKPSQQALSKTIKNVIDNLVETVQPHEVLSGDINTARSQLQNARSLNQRLRLGEVIQEAKFQAENQASTSGVGGNADNAMRQKIKAILNSPKKRASFSPSEQRLMQQIVRGTPTQNALRWAGGFAPQKGFLPAVLAGHLATNAASGGVTGAYTLPVAVGLTGASVAKQIADGMTSRNIDRLSATVRAGRGPALTARQQANQALLELQRRAALAASSASRAVPGSAYTANPNNQ